MAVSNGSACTSQSYTRSHVLTAMGLDEQRIDGAIRMSWCHMTEALPIDALIGQFKRLL
jgi:cysteine desulfurase